ncbi:MAG: ribosome silencing factor [Leptospiraceae bacterium]|nr:ribosome silencing factor [Leptospiraceae bacterium]
MSPETKKILKEILNLLKEKKCEDIVIMNLEEVNTYLSLFVIATVASHTQGRAVARELEKNMKQYKLGSGNTEKKNIPAESGWSLIDLGEIIVHIMTAETRAYYDLDKLWGDAKRITL